MLDALRWSAPGTQIAALTTQPATCLASGVRDTAQVQAGQALFNTPTLLGGQAAKAGLSCASCHVNGRGNPHFLLAGVSDRPGTADVTNSFFSAARSNGRFDPVAIPDLAMPGKVSRDPAARALEPVIRTLIVEEFAGQEPSPAMLDALSAYVRAIQLCPDDIGKSVPRRVQDQLVIIEGALAGAVGMAGRGDAQGARTLIAGARYQLGLVSERFVRRSMNRERAQLLQASRDLQALADQVGTPDQLAVGVDGWRAKFNGGLAKTLRQKEPQSLYNVRNLGFVALQRDNR
jgi:hypothetical protein